MKGLLLAGAMLAGGQALAQAKPQSGPEDLAPAPIKVPVPLPTPSPTPVGEAPLVIVPVEPSTAPQAPPRAHPSPRPTPSATPREKPEPRASPSPKPGPTDIPAPVESVAPAPTPTPEPVLTPEPAPVATPAPQVAAPAPESGWFDWMLAAALGLVVLLVAGLVLWRRRKAIAVDDADIARPIAAAPEPARLPVEPVAASEPVAPSAAPEPPQFLERTAPNERAWIDFVQPAVHRAGLNIVTATADVSLVVRNEGKVPARGIRVAIRLTSAQAGQDAVLDALFAEPVERPAVPPFDLGPGEERKVRAIATLPRDAIVALSAAGREMFVPVVALNALYDAGGARGQTTAAFAVGIERPDGVKLGPLWLDEPPRMHDAIGIRAHGTTVKR
ncbi:MAG: hypothetical protein QM688_13890 [Sphingomonas bacterium]